MERSHFKGGTDDALGESGVGEDKLNCFLEVFVVRDQRRYT